MAEFTEEQIKKVLEVIELIADTLTETPKFYEEAELSGSAGTNTKEWKPVKSGRVLYITHMSAYDDTSSPTKIRLGYWNGHGYVYPKIGIAPLVSETVEFNGTLILGETMWPVVKWEGVTSGDDLHAIVSGHWVKQQRGG